MHACMLYVDDSSCCSSRLGVITGCKNACTTSLFLSSHAFRSFSLEGGAIDGEIIRLENMVDNLNSTAWRLLSAGIVRFASLLVLLVVVGVDGIA